MASLDKFDEYQIRTGRSVQDDEQFLKRSGKAAPEHGHDRHSLRSRLSDPSYIKDAHSKGPQAILKVTSYAKGASVRRVMEYVTRTDRNEIGIPAETEDGKQLHGKEDVQNVYEDWAQDFERKKPGRKTDPRHATHIVLSAKTDNSPKAVRQVHAAASKFLKKEFGDLGYQYIFVVHKDTEYPHVHVVMKNKNNMLKKKLRIGKAELFELRKEFAKALNEQGLEAISTLRRDRPSVIEGVSKQLDTIRNRSMTMNERLMRTERTPAMNTFEIRRYQLLQLESTKQLIKTNTRMLSPQREALTRELKATQSAIVKNDPELLKKQVKATISMFEKEDKQLSKQLNDILTAKKPQNKEQRRERKQREAAFNGYSQKYVKGIKQAIKDVKSSKDLDPKLKKDTLKRLNQQRRSVEKLQARAFRLGL